MIVKLTKTLKFNLGNYEMATVEAGVELDTEVDEGVTFDSASDQLNDIVDAITAPEIEKLSGVILQSQDSALQYYNKAEDNS